MSKPINQVIKLVEALCASDFLNVPDSKTNLCLLTVGTKDNNLCHVCPLHHSTRISVRKHLEAIKNETN